MSFTFANLPGVQVATVDGGLAAVNTPTTKSVMVLGTSAIGPANTPYQVVSLATAAQLFGLNGTLIRAMSEASAYSDNVFLFRVGTAEGSFVVGTSGSIFGPQNAIISAVLVGGQITYTLVSPPTPDLVAGTSITVTGFTNSYYNVTAQPIANVLGSTIVVDLLGHVDESIESPTLADTYASFPTAEATSTTSLTLTFTAAPTTGLIVGAQVVLAALDDAGHNIDASWDQTYTVAQINAHTLILTGSALVVGGPSTLTAGTLTASKALGKQPIASQPGYTVTLGQVDSAANTRYKVWYKNGLLTLWLDNNVVYSNDTGVFGNINTGDSEVTGSATAGTQIGTSTDALANAATAGSVPGYVAPLTGVGLTARQLYIANQNAMNLLQGFPIDEVYLPGSLLGQVGALADNPNVAFYTPTPSTAINNPVTNPQALDWLWTGIDANGDPLYQWASESVFWFSDNSSDAAAVLQNGTPVTAASVVFSDPTTRLAGGYGNQLSGYHEVNFAYQLARFCAAQSEAPQADNGGCLGFIGTSGPASLSDFSLPAVKRWIGALPVYNPVTTTGIPLSSGSGLLGIPFLVGCAAGTLNDACVDHSIGRVPGLFSSVSGEYDGGPEIDANGYKIDDGAYIAVQGDYALLSNGYGTYVGNIGGLVAGFVSSLDQLNAVTNKQAAGVSQLYRASLNQLDSLTFADINMLRFKGTGALPVFLHDKTAATTASDYTLMLRQRIKFLVIQTLLAEANNYIGNGTNDGLTLTALKTSLDADCANLQKRGYLSSYNFTITSTKAQQKVGQASIQISFVPANELVQLNATIGINLNG